MKDPFEAQYGIAPEFPPKLTLENDLTLDPALLDPLAGAEKPRLVLAPEPEDSLSPAPAETPELVLPPALPLTGGHAAAAPKGGWFRNELLFDRNGHLTNDGLQAMQAGRLDELGSLEAAEHLVYCDLCLARYTAALEAAPLLEPARDQLPAVQSELRKRSFHIFTNRYITAAAAVLLAFTLWNVGVFQLPKRSDRTLPEQPPVTISQLFSGVLESAQRAMGSVLGQMQSSLQSGFAQLSDLSAASGIGQSQPGAPDGQT